jgi:hypothetical protein
MPEVSTMFSELARFVAVQIDCDNADMIMHLVRVHVSSILTIVHCSEPK